MNFHCSFSIFKNINVHLYFEGGRKKEARRSVETKGAWEETPGGENPEREGQRLQKVREIVNISGREIYN